MIRRPPRSTPLYSSAASDVYKRQASTSSRRAWVFPVLVIEPWLRLPPLECSAGTRPRNAPMLEPVNLDQSPTSTVNPNAVNVDTPRRHPSRVTIADQAR